MSLMLYNCCHSSITVSALQVQTRNANTLIASQPLTSRITTTKGTKRRRQRYASFSSSLNSHENDFQENYSSAGMNRREVFSSSAKTLFAGLATPFLLDPADPANALLMKFPVDEPNTQPLKNRYHFMRAGNSELEDEGIYSSNPLFLTNRDNAMSDKGYQQLKGAISTLKKTSNIPTVAYHSLAANGMDTGDLIARELKLGRDRLLPEFTYLDQRGIGLWDSNEEELVRPAVWAMDKMEAGKEGFGGKPPANTDGTPNDSLHDQFTRLRQFLSLQETRTAGETILVIFPDGTGPALLSCMIAGIPYSEVHALEFQPGELRTDITVASIKELYEARKDDPAYLGIIEDGKDKLKELRSMSVDDFSVSFKDSRAGEKEAEETRFYAEKQEAIAAQRRKEEEERRAFIQEEQRKSKERAREKEEQRKKEQLALKEQKEQKLREQREAKEKKKAEQQAAYDERKQRLALSASNAAAGKEAKETSESPSFGLPVPALATAALGAIGAAVLSGSDGQDEDKNYSSVSTTKDGSDGGAVATKTAEETPTDPIDTSITSEKQKDLEKDKPELESIPSVVTVNESATKDSPKSKAMEPMKVEEATDDDASTIDDSLKKKEEEFTAKLQAAEQEMKDALIEAADLKEKKQQQQPPKKKSSLFDNNPPVIVTKAPPKTTNYVYDDDEDDSAWLRVLSEIRDEDDDDEDDDFDMVDYASLTDDAQY